VYRVVTCGGSLALAGLVLAATARAAVAQTPMGQGSTWPRVRSTNGNTVTLHLPQVERWTSNWFSARAAVEVKLAQSKKELLGGIWLEAHGTVDRTNRLVTLDRLELIRGRFPEASDGGSNALAAVREVLPTAARTVSLDYLITALGFAQAAARQGPGGLKHTPPEIIWVTNPTVLVLIDGEPVLRPTEATGLERVVNTPALLVHDQAGAKFYLRGGDSWFVASSTESAWSLAQQVPPPVAALAPAPAPVPSAAGNEPPPRIIVRTHPAELLSTSGMPDFQPIRGTALQYAADTDSQLFYHTTSREAYLLLSGRWFKATSLNGPWTRVAPRDLPADFVKIPPGSPQAVVLASVPDTPQAELAVLATTVPTTATVNRREAKIQVFYDGEPQFKPIEGTSLSYAINAQLPVIRSGDNCYALDNGVWFVSAAPAGPWEVAAEVPEEIYTIPPSSPVYYATFARVYEATDDEVEVGYTPGYQGAYEDDGTVVYGTGWDYEPWYGTNYYGWGWTWGYSYLYVPWYQWWAWRPWWRPTHGLWAAMIDNIYDRWEGRVGVAPRDRPVGARTDRSAWAGYTGHPALYGRFQGSTRAAALAPPPNALALNPYARPQTAVRPGEIPRGAQLLTTVRQTPGAGRDLYASPDGNVYLRRNDGWYRRQAGGDWRLAAPAQGTIRQNPAASAGGAKAAGPRSVYQPTPGRDVGTAQAGRLPNAGGELGSRDVAALEREYYARSLSQIRTQNSRPSVSSARTARPAMRR
jgi:hypothetical protein